MFTARYTPTSSSFVSNSGTMRDSNVLDFSDPNNDGIYTAELQVEIASDNVAELNQNLTVVLNPDMVGSEKYFVNSAANTASVFVVDDDAEIPELSLVDISDPIAESAGNAEFTILASVDPEREVTVHYTPSEVGAGDFLTDTVATSTSSSVTFQSQSGQVKGTITVKLNDDAHAEPTGMVKITLNNDLATVPTYTVVSGDSSSTTVTILDNDAPELSIANGPSVIESDISGSPTNAIFTISTAVQPVTNLFLVQYTPTSSAFAVNSGTMRTSHALDFSDPDNDGIYTAELRVAVTSDDVVERNENIEVVLNPDRVGSEKYFVNANANTASVFVVDDDAELPILTISPPISPVFENSNLEFIISASENPHRALNVRYIPVDVDGDFLRDEDEQEKVSPNLYFSNDGNGNFTSSLSISLVDDSTPEVRDKVRVTLIEETGDIQFHTYQIDASSSANSAVATILDNEAPEISIRSGENIIEGDGIMAEFMVISNLFPNGGTLNVWYKPSGEFYLADGVHDVKTSRILQFKAVNGEYMAPLTIEIVSDDQIEQDGTIMVSLSKDSQSEINYSLSPTESTSAVVNIRDDDTPSLSIQSVKQAEGNINGTMTFTVSISPVPLEEVRVSWSTSIEQGNTAISGVDFSAVSNESIVIKAGISSIDFQVMILGDTDVEIDETFTVMIHSSSGGTARIDESMAKAIGTIENDDFGIIIQDAQIEEGDSGTTDLTFKISLSPASTTPIRVNWETQSTSEGAADALDFEMNSGRIEFAPTEIEKTITIKIRGDEIAETNETFTVELSNPTSNGILLDKTGIGTILNDDIGFFVSDAEALEGNLGESTTLLFEVQVAPPFTDETTATINWVTQLIQSDLAAETSDFSMTSNTPNQLRFDKDNSIQMIEIQITGDNIVEADEIFAVEINDPMQEFGIIQSRAIGTIIDNDKVGVSIADSQVEEGNSGYTDLKFVASLNQEIEIPITLEWRISQELGDTADLEDFVAVSNETVTFENASTTANIVVSIIGDILFEPNEEFTITLFNPSLPSKVILSNSVAKGIIINDDRDITKVTISPKSEQITEGETAMFLLSAIPNLSSELEIRYEISQVGEFILWRTSKRFTLVSNSDYLEIETYNDLVGEDSGSITVTLIETEDYIVPFEMKSATVIVNSHNPDVSKTADRTPRISVASLMVNTILNFESEKGESARRTESKSILPRMSIHALNSIIDEGKEANFVIVSDNETELLDINISLGISQVGNFYNGPAKMLLNLHGLSQKAFSVSTIDDLVAEPDGEIIVSIIKDQNYEIAENHASASTIVSDFIDREARQEKIVSNMEQLLPIISKVENEILNSTLSSRFQTEERNSYFNLGDQKIIQDLIIKTGETVNSDKTLVTELIDKSSFEFNIFPDSDFANTISVWGQNNFQNLNSTKSETVDIGSGELFNSQFGFDTKFTPELIIGLGTSFTRTTVNLNSSNLGNIKFQTSSNQFNPYFGWSSADGSSEIRSVIGIGFGGVTANQSGYDLSIYDNELFSVAFEGRVGLLPEQKKTDIDFIGQSKLKNFVLRENGEFYEDIEFASRNSRIALEGLHNFKFNNTASLTPNFSIGLIESKSTDQSVFLSELAGGIGYTSPLGLEINGEGRIYLNKLARFDEWKFNSLLKYDHGQDNLGLKMSVSSEFCSNCAADSVKAFNGNLSLFSNQVDLNDEELESNTKRISSEFGYGIRLGDGIEYLSPFVGLEVFGDKITQQQIGGRVSLNSNIKFELLGTRDSKIGLNENYSVKINGALKW